MLPLEPWRQSSAFPPLFKGCYRFLRLRDARVSNFKREKLHLSGAVCSDKCLKPNSSNEEVAEIRGEVTTVAAWMKCFSFFYIAVIETQLENIQPFWRGKMTRWTFYHFLKSFLHTHLLFWGQACWIRWEVCLSSAIFRYLKLWSNHRCRERNYLSESIDDTPRFRLGALCVQVVALDSRAARTTHSKEFCSPVSAFHFNGAHISTISAKEQRAGLESEVTQLRVQELPLFFPSWSRSVLADFKTNPGGWYSRSVSSRNNN